MSLTELMVAVERRRAAFAEELDRLEVERRSHAEDAAELERQRERNGQELAGYLLPDLDDEDLLALERKLRYPALLAEKRKTEARLAELEAERAAIEASAIFIERAVRRIDYEGQLAEIAEAAASFKHDREVWERSDHFHNLRLRGWFAPEYDGGLFDWLRDWRSCSLLMAELEAGFPGVTFPDDEDVKAAWHSHYADSEPVLGLERELLAKLAELDALEARHAVLLAAPDELFQALWRSLATLIIEHLRASPDDVLLRAARGDETMSVFLKKDHGLAKQAAYLREVMRTRVEPQQKRIGDEIRKLELKLEKLRYKRARGKYVFVTASDVASLDSLPYEKWQSRRASYAKTRARLTGFNQWERGSFVQDFLWWDLITRGAHGDDLHEVMHFHQQHPGWSVDSFRDPLDGSHHAAEHANDLAADAAVDAMMADDTGLDPS